MSDTTIDDLLAKDRATKPDGTEMVIMVEGDLSSMIPLKSALYDLIDKKIIGEDEPDETDKWTPEMADVISATRRIIYGRNALRAEQRNKLKGLFDE